MRFQLPSWRTSLRWPEHVCSQTCFPPPACGWDISELLAGTIATRPQFIHIFSGNNEFMDGDTLGTEGAICDLTFVEAPVHVDDEVYGFEMKVPWNKTPCNITWHPSGPGSYIAVRREGHRKFDGDSTCLVQCHGRAGLRGMMPAGGAARAPACVDAGVQPPRGYAVSQVFA